MDKSKTKVTLENFLINYIDSLNIEGNRGKKIYYLVNTFDKDKSNIDAKERKVDVVLDEDKMEKFKNLVVENNYATNSQFVKQVVLDNYIEDLKKSIEDEIINNFGYSSDVKSSDTETVNIGIDDIGSSDIKSDDMRSVVGSDYIGTNVETGEVKSGDVGSNDVRPRLRQRDIIDEKKFENKKDRYFKKLINNNEFLSYDIHRERNPINVKGLTPEQLPEKFSVNNAGNHIAKRQTNIGNADALELIFIDKFRTYPREILLKYKDEVEELHVEGESINSVEKVINFLEKKGEPSFTEWLSKHNLDEEDQVDLSVDFYDRIEEHEELIYPNKDSYVYLWLSGKLPTVSGGTVHLYGLRDIEFDETAVENLKELLAYEKIKEEKTYEEHTDEEIFEDEILKRIYDNPYFDSVVK
ncbi:MAG: hypothetical protein ACOCQD_00315 [archaeon]